MLDVAEISLGWVLFEGFRRLVGFRAVCCENSIKMGTFRRVQKVGGFFLLDVTKITSSHLPT